MGQILTTPNWYECALNKNSNKPEREFIKCSIFLDCITTQSLQNNQQLFFNVGRDLFEQQNMFYADIRFYNLFYNQTQEYDNFPLILKTYISGICYDKWSAIHQLNLSSDSGYVKQKNKGKCAYINEVMSILLTNQLYLNEIYENYKVMSSQLGFNYIMEDCPIIYQTAKNIYELGHNSEPIIKKVI